MMKTKLTAAMVFLSAVLAHGEDAFKVTVTPSTGQKPRPAMVLVPGLASDGAVWQSVVEHYRDRYDCHALTMAGFAGAPAVEGSTLEKARIELAAYIQAQKLERPVIVGHSMGGVLALWLASEKPDLTGPLVVVDAVPFLPALSFPDATVDSARPHVDSMKAMLSGLSGENWRKFQLTSPVLKAMASGEKDQARIAEWGAASDPRAVSQAMGDVFGLDLREAVGRIRSKVLVLAATKDRPQDTFAAYERQYAKLAQRRLVRVDTARHFIMYDDPVRLLAEMDAFLGAR